MRIKLQSTSDGGTVRTHKTEVNDPGQFLGALDEFFRISTSINGKHRLGVYKHVESDVLYEQPPHPHDAPVSKEPVSKEPVSDAPNPFPRIILMLDGVIREIGSTDAVGIVALDIALELRSELSQGGADYAA